MKSHYIIEGNVMNLVGAKKSYHRNKKRSNHNH